MSIMRKYTIGLTIFNWDNSNISLSGKLRVFYSVAHITDTKRGFLWKKMLF